MKRAWKVASGVSATVVSALVVVYFAAPGTMLKGAMFAERGRAGLDAKIVQAAGHRVHYLIGGPVDGPVLLLVHGFSGDKDNWTRFSTHLTDRFRVVALDLPGWGLSTRDPKASYDIVAQAERLDAFVTALKLERFHIVGNSMGGHIAGVYAERFGDKVASVSFFANGGVQSPVKSDLTKALEGGTNPLIVDTAEDYEKVLAMVFTEPPFIPAPVKRYFAAQSVKHRGFTDKIWSDLRAKPAPLEPVLPKIAAPVLILWGDGDRFLHVSTVPVMQRLLPSAKTVIMEHCGHVPMIERPEEAARHLASFLATLR